jgi:uncharacterized protein (TIGR03437 family)
MLNRLYHCLFLSILSCGLACGEDMASAFAGTKFGILNLTTGSFSPVGNFSSTIIGLGVANGKLFGVGPGGLYHIDVTNGNLSLVGTSPTQYDLFGSTLTGLYGTSDNYLYSVDAVTGITTKIGNGLLPGCGTRSSSLSTNSSTLYLNCSGKLYTINVTDGTATLIGANNSGAFRWIQALSSTNGVLYGIDYGPPTATVILNTRTGALTTGPNTSALAGASHYGLAPIIQAPAPTVTPNGVVPIFGASTTIEPGSWVSIYGTNLAGATSLWSGDFPTSLGGVSVTINNKPAYLWLVSPGQINLQAPDDSATGTVPVVVTNANGSTTTTVVLGRYSPSFSMFSSKYAAAIVPTAPLPGNSGSGYDLIGPSKAFSFTSRPVKAGETLVLYGVGFGPTNPAVTAGKIFSGAASSVDLPSITIGGVSATVSFAGMIQAGLFQINLVVPNVGSGDQPLQASVGGVTTSANTVYVAVQ